MLSCAKLTAAQAGTYFEKEKDYYTKHQSNYDRWHGALAKTRGFEGEISKEQFDSYLDFVNQQGRSTAAVDMTFSASKSVSLTMARSAADRENMIRAHQKAVDKVAHHVEQMIYTRSKKVRARSRAMAAAEFLHFTARPSERNGYRPDLDLHSHLVLLNDTYADGTDLSIDYRNILDDKTIKELGLEYRAALAVELQNMGYELVVTDPQHGFFEIRGYDDEVLDENSNRRKDIVQTANEHGMTDMQKANQYSRNAKSKATATVEDVLQEKHEELFESGRVRIERGETIYYGKHDNNGDSGDSGEVYDHEAPPRKRSVDGVAGNERPFLGTFIRESGVRKLPRLHVVQNEWGTSGVLSKDATDRLAVEQTARVRDFHLLRQTRPERVKEIDEVAQEAIRKLSDEKFAYTVKEAENRIRAEGVLLDISQDEAAKALERQAVVALGQLKDAEGKTTQERYISTEENIQKERDIKESVARGRGKITSHLLTTQESRELLRTLEDDAIKRGETDFSIADGADGGEQAEAVHHIMSCQDQYIAVDGLAGTGKTTMMQRLHWMADHEGITVRGACFTGEAAKNLQADSGIESDTIHRMLNQLEKESGVQPPPTKKGEVRQHWDFSRVQRIPEGQREIWAIDEAGLVSNNLMWELQRAAEARGAQILLLGDPDQLPPVSAGMPMKEMEEAGMATARLTFIRRQKEEELLSVVYNSQGGSPIKAVQTLKEQGRFHEIEKTADRREAVTNEMTNGIPLSKYKETLLLVSTNADRKAYNRMIRQRYVDRGELAEGRKYKVTVRDGTREKTESRLFAAGDRVVFKKNDNKIKVKNGMTGMIEKEDGKSITVLTDEGERVTFNVSDYNHLDYSYAITEYGAQGLTVDRVVIDMPTKTAPQTRNALYVALSRARYKALLFTDNESRLEHQIRKWAKKITSRDFADKLDEMRKNGGIQNNDRYHAPEVDAAAQIDKALAEIKLHTLQTEVVKPKERSADRPQQTNEAPTQERASSSQEPNLSTSRGISRTPDQNAPVESPVSLSKEVTRPSTRTENPENPRFADDFTEEELAEYRKDPLEYVAKRAPDETALVIEDANTITGKEFFELRQFTDKLGKNVSPFDVTLARDGVGHLHVLPYKITATEWRAGDRITFGQLATARHESWKLRNRFTASSVRGKCARAQHALFNSISKGAVKGAIFKGIGGVQSVASAAQDALSIFDPTVRGKDKAKAGMKQVTEAIIQTPVKIIMDIFSPPIIGILKAPFHAAGGIIKAGIGATKTAFGLMQESAERDEQPQQQEHSALVRRK